MPDEKTRADSLREYLTGAATDGGIQTDPDESLGNYRSSTEAESMSIVVTDPIANITIDYAGGGNTVGAGSLYAADANTLQWKCYGEDYGASVSIANGETKIVETLGMPGAFVRVTRTSAVALTGTAVVTLARAMNNVFALDDVTTVEASAGDDEYRATIVVNESPVTITEFKRWIGTLGTPAVSDGAQLGASGAGSITTTGSFADWPDNGWCHILDGTATREIIYYSERTSMTLTIPADGRARLGTSAAAGEATDTIHPVPGIAIAIDTDGVTAGGEAIQTIADEDTEPTSVAWVTGITEATGLDIGDMDTTEQVGLWIWREVPVGAVSSANVTVLVEDSFNSA